jgi:hypothetical protein
VPLNQQTEVLQLWTQTGLFAWGQVCSRCQIEEVVNELNLPKEIISCHPSNLFLPNHVDCFVALNGSPGRLKV